MGKQISEIAQQRQCYFIRTVPGLDLYIWCEQETEFRMWNRTKVVFSLSVCMWSVYVFTFCVQFARWAYDMNIIQCWETILKL